MKVRCFSEVKKMLKSSIKKYGKGGHRNLPIHFKDDLRCNLRSRIEIYSLCTSPLSYFRCLLNKFYPNLPFVYDIRENPKINSCPVQIMEVAILIVTSRLNDVTHHEKKSLNGPNAHLTCLKQNNDVFNNLVLYTFLILLNQVI